MRDNVAPFPTALHVKRGGGDDGPSDPLDPLTLAYHPKSDSGLAKRFVARFGDRFRFVPTQGWYHYNGKHWKLEGAEFAALNAARIVAGKINDEAQAVELANAAQRKRVITSSGEEHDPENDAASTYAKQLRHFATKAGDMRHLRGMLECAKADLLASLDDFDRDPLALNVGNGTLRFLRDKEASYARLDPHNPADMITRIAAADYDPDAECPHWEAHLEKMQPDSEMRGYVRRTLGYSATGLIGEQCFFVHQGRGGDGKSVTLNTNRRVLGTYSQTADVQAFLAQKQGNTADNASPALASLAGDTRLVSLSEPQDRSVFNDGLLKVFTGGGEVRSRHLRRDLFSFRPRGKLHFECNKRPRIPGMDEGIWRRTKLVRWPMKLPRSEWDTELEERLVAEESAGVLRWLVEAVLQYLDRGLGEPAAMIKARADWRQSSNTIGEWLEESVFVDVEATCSQKALYDSYRAFCEDNSYMPVSPPTFYEALDNLQIEKTGRKSQPDRNWERSGARLKTAVEREAETGSHDARKPENDGAFAGLGEMPF